MTTRTLLTFLFCCCLSLAHQSTEVGRRGRSGPSAVPGAVKDNRNGPECATTRCRWTEENLVKDRPCTRPSARRFVRVSVISRNTLKKKKKKTTHTHTHAEREIFFFFVILFHSQMFSFFLTITRTAVIYAAPPPPSSVRNDYRTCLFVAF